MKKALFVLVFTMTCLATAAEEEVSPATTQADWFSPTCPGCAKLLTPGTANLGNSKNIFRRDDKSKKKKPVKATQPVSSER